MGNKFKGFRLYFRSNNKIGENDGHYLFEHMEQFQARTSAAVTKYRCNRYSLGLWAQRPPSVSNYAQFLWGFSASCNRIRGEKTAVMLKEKSNNRLPWSSQRQQQNLPFKASPALLYALKSLEAQQPLETLIIITVMSNSISIPTHLGEKKSQEASGHVSYTKDATLA